MSATIDVRKLKNAKCVELKIPEFFETSDDIEKHKSSMTLFQKKCTLYVYPQGAYRATPDYLVILFFLLEPDSNISVNLLLEAKSCEEAVYSKTIEGDNEEGHYKVWSWLYENEKLQSLLHDDVLRGKLIISCNEPKSNTSSTAVAACQTTFQYNTVRFCRDFQDLFLNGKKSDASIEVKGRLFKVHKLILEGCSPVFSAMFDHNIAEKNKNTVQVDDCDPNIFQKFLKCLYSGKLENIFSDDLLELYKISDKYGAFNLKGKCSELMVKELSEDNVFYVLSVADMCNDVQLKASVQAFMAKNIKIMLRTEKWKKMQSENPFLAAEILAKVFED